MLLDNFLCFFLRNVYVAFFMESYNKQINFIIVYYYSFSSVNIVWIFQTFFERLLKDYFKIVL